MPIICMIKRVVRAKREKKIAKHDSIIYIGSGRLCLRISV